MAGRSSSGSASTAKLDGLIDGLKQLAAMPDLIGPATLRRELDEGWCSSG